MNYQLGRDESGKSNQKFRMYFNVAQKSQPTCDTRKGANRGQQEKRKPSNPYKNHKPTKQQLKVISSEMGSAKELKEWTAEYY